MNYEISNILAEKFLSARTPFVIAANGRAVQWRKSDGRRGVVTAQTMAHAHAELDRVREQIPEASIAEARVTR